MAQFGRALRSGRRGRGFESRRFDSLAGAPETLCYIGFPVFFLFKNKGVKSIGHSIISLFRFCWNCNLDNFVCH